MKIAENQEMRKTLARTADESVASLRAIEVSAGVARGDVDDARNAGDVGNAYENAVNEVEKFDRLVIIAVNRASEITLREALKNPLICDHNELR